MTTKSHEADGVLETREGRDVLRFERRLDHPVERVWRAITEPAEIVQWLAEAQLELGEGGNVTLRWLNSDQEGNTAVARGTVRAVDPPRLLELDTDIHGVLRWELQDDNGGCRLIFTASYPSLPEDARLDVLSGWHIHLDHLADALAGQPVDWPRWSKEHRPRWKEHRDRYAVTSG
jgi:uncharacterized protein YndB with AHSA1/START domain